MVGAMNWKDGMIFGMWIGAVMALVVTWLAGGLGIGVLGVVNGLLCIGALVIGSIGYEIAIIRRAN